MIRSEESEHIYIIDNNNIYYIIKNVFQKSTLNYQSSIQIYKLKTDWIILYTFFPINKNYEKKWELAG